MTSLDDVDVADSEAGPDSPDDAVGDRLSLECPVSAHRSAPGRTVFTEQDNTEAWIATDTVVGLER